MEGLREAKAERDQGDTGTRPGLAMLRETVWCGATGCTCQLLGELESSGRRSQREGQSPSLEQASPRWSPGQASREGESSLELHS